MDGSTDVLYSPTMKPPRDVSGVLADWKYFPVDRDDFGKNLLAERVKDHAETEPRCFASLCAVPRGRPIDRVSSVEALDGWLDPNKRQYDPPGLWIPHQGRTLTSGGILRLDEHENRWESYLHVGFDGYIEFGRVAGSCLKGKRYFRYGPIVRWIQRFAAFGRDLQTVLEPAPEYWIALNIAAAEGARLAVLGEGWRQPFDPWGDEDFPQAIEEHVQIARPANQDDEPAAIARWFAERIGAAFGMNQPRCYNRSGGSIGELPIHDF